MKDGQFTICLDTLRTQNRDECENKSTKCFVPVVYQFEETRDTSSFGKTLKYVPDVALADHDAGHVDGLGKTHLVDLGLQAALEQLLGGQLEHEVELALFLAEESVADQAADEGLTLEDAGLVALGEGQQDTGGLTDLREHELGAPDLALAAETILTAQLELLVEALLAERTARSLEGFAVVAPLGGGDHGSTQRQPEQKK